MAIWAAAEKGDNQISDSETEEKELCWWLKATNGGKWEPDTKLEAKVRQEIKKRVEKEKGLETGQRQKDEPIRKDEPKPTGNHDPGREIKTKKTKEKGAENGQKEKKHQSWYDEYHQKNGEWICICDLCVKNPGRECEDYWPRKNIGTKGNGTRLYPNIVQEFEEEVRKRRAEKDLQGKGEWICKCELCVKTTGRECTENFPRAQVPQRTVKTWMDNRNDPVEEQPETPNKGEKISRKTTKFLTKTYIRQQQLQNQQQNVAKT